MALMLVGIRSIARSTVPRLIVLCALFLTVAVAPVAAAGPTVARPTATAAFLDAITFRAEATLTADVARVELLLDLEGSTRTIVADVPTASTSGATTLRYTFETPGGSILPGTDVTARFRLVLNDGATIVGPPVSVHYDDDRYRWSTVDGAFVRVYYTEGGVDFGRRAAKIGDDAIRDVSELLGVSEGDPVDFYVYADRNAFYDVIGPGARENVGGEAHPDIRALFANIGPDIINDPWVSVVIPHELTHLVFDTAVANPYHYPPRWLNEGIAVYLSEGYGASDRAAVRAAAGDGSIMPLSALVAQFPTTRDRFFLAYSESVAAVSYLVDTYGRDAMVQLVRSYADGVSDDEAFMAALGVDGAGFDAAWLTSVGAAVPEPYGPQPAPPGPVPAAWGGPPATAAPSGAPAPSSEPGPPIGGGETGTLVAALGFVLVVLAVAFGWAIRRNRAANRLALEASRAAAPPPSLDGPSGSAPVDAPVTGAGGIGGSSDSDPGADADAPDVDRSSDGAR